jgi:hypothetical protein
MVTDSGFSSFYVLDVNVHVLVIFDGDSRLDLLKFTLTLSW